MLSSLVFVVTLLVVVGLVNVDGYSLNNWSSRKTGNGIVSKVRGGCAVVGRCCQGKDNACRSTGLRMNQLRDDVGSPAGDKDNAIDDAKDSYCFCDSACLELGDCCVDYEQVCRRKYRKDVAGFLS